MNSSMGLIPELRIPGCIGQVRKSWETFVVACPAVGFRELISY